MLVTHWATRGQYLALSKAWRSCFVCSWFSRSCYSHSKHSCSVHCQWATECHRQG